jgi:hypothetical protein
MDWVIAMDDVDEFLVEKQNEDPVMRARHAVGAR